MNHIIWIMLCKEYTVLCTAHKFHITAVQDIICLKNIMYSACFAHKFHITAVYDII
jgi:hypothetical protein